MLKTMPLDVEIGENIWITYGLTSAPINVNSFSTCGLSGYLYLKGHKQPPPYDPPAVPVYDSGNSKGIQFFLTDYLLQTGIDAGYSANLYQVDLQYTILNYDLDMHCFAITKSPQITFNNSVKAFASGQCDFKAKNNSNG